MPRQFETKEKASAKRGPESSTHNSPKTVDQIPISSLKVSYSELHDVDVSEFALRNEGGQGLCTQALVTCVGIAVTVAYSSESRPAEPRPDKFLAHIDEDDGHEAAAELAQHVMEAKRRGLKNMHVVACAMCPESLRERPEEPVDEATIRGRWN